MVQCQYITAKGIQCSRQSVSGSNYCSQHLKMVETKSACLEKESVVQHKTYLTLLPSDLILPLFLYFDSGELISVITRLRDHSNIIRQQDFLQSMEFWTAMWRRDISSLVIPDDVSYYQYVSVMSDIRRMGDAFASKVLYLAPKGYDILLYPLLTTKDERNTAMWAAAMGGHIEIVRIMLKKGADKIGVTMHHAAAKGHTDIVKLMLEHGASKYKEDMRLSLREAASGGYTATVSLLLDNGATNLNQALDEAATKGHYDTVKLLLDRGATEYGYPLYHAKQKKHKNIVKLIESYKNK